MYEINLNIPEHNKLMVLITLTHAQCISDLSSVREASLLLSYRKDLLHATIGIFGEITRLQFEQLLLDNYEIWMTTDHLKISF